MDGYCARRIEVERIEELEADWKQVKSDHRYLEEVLLHEFLMNNIKLTEKERELAKNCIKMVGDFYERASKEAVHMMIPPKRKPTKTSKLKYRRD